MKRQWRIRRQISPKLDGQQRWDRAYQLLLQWSQPNLPGLPHPLFHPTQEVYYDYQNSGLPQGFDPDPGPSSNH